ncbi:MAG: ABC transporter permease [Stellaceae bacterium]
MTGMRTIRHAGLLPSIGMLIAAFLINAWLQPDLLTHESLSINIATFAPTVLVSAAQAVIVLSGELDLSVGTGVSMLNCALAAFPGLVGWGVWPSVAATLAIALVAGATNGILVAFLRLPSLIVTFATSAIWFGVALIFQPQPGGSVPESFGDFYASSILGVPVALVLILVALGAWSALQRLPMGRQLLAVGSNPLATFHAGIDVRWVKFRGYCIAWCLVYLSSLAISAQTLSGDSRLGLPYTLTSIAAVVIGGISLAGGRGSIWGAAFGALSLGLVVNIIYFAGIPSIYQEFFKGVVILIALSFTFVVGRRRTA